jgi:mannitol-1-phosphate 5-dehydrogenase
VDGTALLTPLPALPEVRATPHYSADLRAKLYVFNAGHAIVAYLGWLRRHRTIDAAIADPLLRPIVVGCLLESRKALLAVHPELGDDAHGPVAEALERYAEPELADPISRVARDPKRKLSPGDRLLGPAALIREATGQVPAHLALGVAGALLYRDPQDRQAEELRGALSSRGLRAVLSDVCGIGGDDHMGHAVEVRYRGFIFTPSEILFPPVHTTDALLAPRFPEPVGPAGDADDVGDIDRDAPVVRS